MTDDASVLIEGVYDCAAPAEVVFGTLTDPDRTSRWLPGGMTAEYDDPGLARVRAGGDVHRFRVATYSGELRVEWSSAAEAGLLGSARVRDGAAGGSTVEITLRVPADGPDPRRVRELMDEGAAHLRRDVEDNFNAG